MIYYAEVDACEFHLWNRIIECVRIYYIYVFESRHESIWEICVFSALL